MGSVHRIRQDPQVATPSRPRSDACRRGGTVGSPVASALRLVEIGVRPERRPCERSGGADLADGLGERRQILVFGRLLEAASAAEHLPASRDGDAIGVFGAQVPRMRFVGAREGADDRCRLRIDEGQRGHGQLGAAWAAALTRGTHSHTISCRVGMATIDTRPRLAFMAFRLAPLQSGHRLLSPAPRRTRDRRGHGLRGPLLPPGAPARRTKSDEFDRAAVDAFAELDARWHDRLAGLDVAVDDIPGTLPRGSDPSEWETIAWPEEVTADGPVPLARLIPAAVDAQGRPTRAQIVLFRRPLELRALDDDLRELLREILIQQVATYLGVDEETVEDGPES